jgi:hypothetical protein
MKIDSSLNAGEGTNPPAPASFNEVRALVIFVLSWFIDSLLNLGYEIPLEDDRGFALIAQNADRSGFKG